MMRIIGYLPTRIASTTHATAVHLRIHTAHARRGQRTGAAHTPCIHGDAGAIAHPARVHATVRAAVTRRIHITALWTAQASPRIDEALTTNTAHMIGVTSTTPLLHSDAPLDGRSSGMVQSAPPQPLLHTHARDMGSHAR